MAKHVANFRHAGRHGGNWKAPTIFISALFLSRHTFLHHLRSKPGSARRVNEQ
jgi:hypothetical protein